MSLLIAQLAMAKMVIKPTADKKSPFYFHGHVHTSQVYSQVNTTWWY